MMVKYYLGGRLGHGMWSSVGWIFGTVETQVPSQKRIDGRTDRRKMDTITTTHDQQVGIPTSMQTYARNLTDAFFFKHGCCRASRSMILTIDIGQDAGELSSN